MAHIIIFVIGVLFGVYLGNKTFRQGVNKTSKDTAVYLQKTFSKKKEKPVEPPKVISLK